MDRRTGFIQNDIGSNAVRHGSQIPAAVATDLTKSGSPAGNLLLTIVNKPTPESQLRPLAALLPEGLGRIDASVIVNPTTILLQRPRRTRGPLQCHF